jgi:predicted Zn-dependent protease
LFLLLSSLMVVSEETPMFGGEAEAHNGGMYLPVSMLRRLPLNSLLPQVKVPKKVDAKYDVSRIGIRNVGSGLDFYSIDKEIALGRELAREVESHVKLVNDPVITEYVNRIGQRLVRNSDAKVPFTIKVIDDDEINAFALPGGFFYVNTGLILASDNEAGLAGVMAHEIAHVAARHATKNETKSDIINLASIPLMFFGGPAAMILRQAASLAVPMSMLKFGRDAEREADLLGVQYDYASGYDPEEFVKLFEKLQVTEKKKKSLIAKAFSTHPMTGDRIKRAQKEIQEYLPERDDYVVDTSEFQEVRQRVAELTDRRRIDLGKVTPVLYKRDGEHQTNKSDANGPVLKKKD